MVRRRFTREAFVVFRKSSILKWMVFIGVGALFLGFFTVIAIDWNAHVTVQAWLAPLGDKNPPPIKTVTQCFQGSSYSPQKHGLVPSVPLQAANTCFDFANIIRQPESRNQSFPTLFHTYWSRSKAPKFGDPQLSILRSFAATQDKNTQLWLWVDPADTKNLLASPQWQLARKQLGNRLQHMVIDTDALLADTPLSSVAERLNTLILYKHGGLWFNIDTVFVRNMAPLLVEDWVAGQSCDLSLTMDPTVALLHFEKNSPFLCELLSTLTMFNTPSELFMHVYRQIWYRGYQAWTILPWCYTDPFLCRTSLPVSDAIVYTLSGDGRLDQIFTYRWHNPQKKPPSELLHILNSHRDRLGW